MSSDTIKERTPASADAAKHSHGASLQLLYHELTSEQSDYTYSLNTEAFKQHLEYFRQLRSSPDLALRPEVTFDDGHVSNFEHALPALANAGMVARFFITVGWTSTRPGYMSWEQLRELHRAGQTVGAHGWTHTLLNHCSDADLDHELRDARLLLEDKLGAAVDTVSLPGGRFDRRVLEACERAGYTQVFTSIPRAEITAGAPLVGRLNVRADATVSWLGTVLNPRSGVLRRLAIQYQFKETAKRALGDDRYARLWAKINRADPAAHLA